MKWTWEWYDLRLVPVQTQPTAGACKSLLGYKENPMTLMVDVTTIQYSVRRQVPVHGLNTIC